MEMNDLLVIKKAIDQLDSGELKTYLGFVLREIKWLKEQPDLHEEFVAKLIQLYDDLIKFQEKKGKWDPAPESTHVHVVCGDSFAGSMKHALQNLGWSETHKVITLRENYAIGPLNGLDTSEGRKARSKWFHENISEAFTAYADVEEEYNDLLDKIERIPDQARMIIWTSRSAREQVGMRHAIHLLSGSKKGNSTSVHDGCAICEKLYNRPDVSMTYLHSGEIPPDKLQQALLHIDEGDRLNDAAIAQLKREWQVISERSGVLRIWRENAVEEVPVDYYDHYLLQKLDKLRPPAEDNGFIKAARLIGEAIGYCDQYIGDSYFEYRLRELIYDGVLEIKGVPAAMRYYSVRRKRHTNR
ncbi:DUF1835 domain-containing protein [Marinicrinis lubricantis]|uniref:DUF1835 domain-containing protein n=1 Tax=Marinicrinis lubricantis TaxID=2086470 RepID=A0ABW1ISG1_9BACL